MKLTREEVQHIALLARLSLSNDEVEQMRAQLSDILDKFEALRQVDTTGVTPMTHSVPLENVFREDRIVASLSVAEVFRNAPLKEDDSFKVKAVLEEQ